MNAEAQGVDRSAASTVRGVAIDHHHHAAGRFERFYADLEADRFASAFTYGRARLELVLDESLKALRPGARILDVGCGTGRHLARLRELGFDALGVEPAPGMLAAARRLDPSLRIVQGVATALPLREASVDLVVAIEVLRYLHHDDVRAALREMMRVLRPGGRVLVTMVNRWALDGFFLHQRLGARLRRRSFDREHPHCEFTTPARLAADLASAGARDVRTIGRLFAPLRIAYKAHPALGRRMARALEPYDDAVCSLPGMTALAGHLVGIGVKA